MPPGSLLAAVQQGLAFTADTDFQAITLGQYLRAQFKNPTGSGRICYVYNFGGYTAIASQNFIQVLKNSSTTVNTNQITPSNQNMASPATPQATLFWDTNVSAAAGGTPYRKLALPAGSYQEFKSNIIAVYPGQSVTVQAQAAIAGSVLMHLDWLELPN